MFKLVHVDEEAPALHVPKMIRWIRIEKRIVQSYGAKADSIGHVNYTLLADGTRVYEGEVYDGTRVYLDDSPYSAFECIACG